MIPRNNVDWCYSLFHVMDGRVNKRDMKISTVPLRHLVRNRWLMKISVSLGVLDLVDHHVDETTAVDILFELYTAHVVSTT